MSERQASLSHAVSGRRERGATVGRQRTKQPGIVHPSSGKRAVWVQPPCAVHVVTAENRNLYEQELEASFRLRHHVYVTERRWEQFRSPDLRETDQYDNADAIYLLAIEEDGRRLVGGARLVPTIGGPVLGEFRNLAGGYPMPRSPSVFHLSRSIVVAERREGRSLNAVAATVLCGIQEYCLVEDIEQLTLLVRMSLLPTFLDLGWNPQPLSLPEVLWGASCVVASVDVSELALRQTHAARGTTDSVLVRRGITLPAVPRSPASGRLC